mmetsp:Transcript_29523/g.62650  ORF Transcript_29523/g.62650 Transcript_29523/m.62650 type:complete len:82 (-) Transcript_29523:202-447(-)
MGQFGHKMAWGAGADAYLSDDEVKRQFKMAEIIGLEYKDKEVAKHGKALRFAFLEVDKRFRWCFEDAVDPTEKAVDVHRGR